MALVLFLRGVNVGGHKTFRPTVLARQLRHLDVVSIGAAGTFVVGASVTQAALRAAVVCRLPFDAQVMICRGSDIRRLLSRDPFSGTPDSRAVVRFVSVLARQPRAAPVTPLQLPARGRWELKLLARDGRFVLGLYRRRMKAIGYLGEIDRLFGVPATTRNWNTIRLIGKALEESA